MRAYFYRMNLLDVPHALLSGFRMKMRHEAHVFGFGTLLKGWNVMDRLGAIDIPTLVLAGRFDYLFPSEHQAILADHLPNAQLEIIERAGHLAHAERSIEVIDIMRRFMLNNRRQPLVSRPPALVDMN